MSPDVAAHGRRCIDPARPSLPPPPPPPRPPSGLEVASRIVQREGVGGLWRGTLATMASLSPNSAVWWVTHEDAKSHVARQLRLSEDHPFVHGWSGALAGVTSTVFTNPLDVIKTRLQCAEQPTTVRAVVQGVVAEAGWRGFYSGLLPRIAAAVPRSVCTVLMYERAIAWCRKAPDRDDAAARII